MKRKDPQYSQMSCRMRQILCLWPLVGPPLFGSQTFLVLTPPLLMKDLETGGSAMCHVSVDHLLFLQESWPCRVAQCMCMTRAQSPYRRCTPPSLNTCRSSSTRDYWGKSSNWGWVNYPRTQGPPHSHIDSVPPCCAGLCDCGHSAIGSCIRCWDCDWSCIRGFRSEEFTF